MLFRTKTGKLIDDNELNSLTPMEIEDYGIHAVDHWNNWQENA